MISIEAVGPEEWKVTVTGAARTEHRVRVRAADMEDLFAENHFRLRSSSKRASASYWNGSPTRPFSPLSTFL